MPPPPLDLQIQRDAATIMQPYFTSNGLVTKALEHAFKLEHIMDVTRLRCLGSLFSMLHQACRNVAQYNSNHPDFPMQIEQLERYIQVSGALSSLLLEGRGSANSQNRGPGSLSLHQLESQGLHSCSNSAIWCTPSFGPCPGIVG